MKKIDKAQPLNRHFKLNLVVVSNFVHNTSQIVKQKIAKPFDVNNFIAIKIENYTNCVYIQRLKISELFYFNYNKKNFEISLHRTQFIKLHTSFQWNASAFPYIQFPSLLNFFSQISFLSTQSWFDFQTKMFGMFEVGLINPIHI